MTTTIRVIVNGDFKIPVKQGSEVTWVSGRGRDGPAVFEFHPAPGEGAVFLIGPEEIDRPEPVVVDRHEVDPAADKLAAHEAQKTRPPPPAEPTSQPSSFNMPRHHAPGPASPNKSTR
jgi:hypothetical protein